MRVVSRMSLGDEKLSQRYIRCIAKVIKKKCFHIYYLQYFSVNFAIIQLVLVNFSRQEFEMSKELTSI